jgi:hypothetical protein
MGATTVVNFVCSFVLQQGSGVDKAFFANVAFELIGICVTQQMVAEIAGFKESVEKNE